MTFIDVALAAIAVSLAAGVAVLHHHLRRLVAAVQPPAAEPLGIAWEQWQADEQTWRAVREALGESATDMERTPS